MKKQLYVTPQTTAVHVAPQQVICTSDPTINSGDKDDEVQPDQDSDGHYLAE